jgi:hypothetical protein
MLQGSAGRRHDNRDRSRSTQRRSNRRSKMRNNDIDALAYEFVGKLFGAIASPPCVVELGYDVLT